jgi:hypothetical protein
LPEREHIEKCKELFNNIREALVLAETLVKTADEEATEAYGQPIYNEKMQKHEDNLEKLNKIKEIAQSVDQNDEDQLEASYTEIENYLDEMSLEKPKDFQLKIGPLTIAEADLDTGDAASEQPEGKAVAKGKGVPEPDVNQTASN